MALSQTSSSQMISDLMLLQPVILGSQNVMNAVDAATIERRIRISRPDEGRGRCKGSRVWDPRKDFSQPTQPHITPSTSSAISPRQERTEPSGHRPCRRGVKSSLRREPDVPGDLLCPRFGNVTEPSQVRLKSTRKDFIASVPDGTIDVTETLEEILEKLSDGKRTHRNPCEIRYLL